MAVLEVAGLHHSAVGIRLVVVPPGIAAMVDSHPIRLRNQRVRVVAGGLGAEFLRLVGLLEPEAALEY